MTPNPATVVAARLETGIGAPETGKFDPSNATGIEDDR